MISNEYLFCGNMLSVEITFSAWLLNELSDKGMTQSQLAKAAGLSRGTVSNILNGNRGVGEDTLISIAHAFKIPPEIIFRAAGFLPPEINKSPTLEEVNYKMDQLTEDQQQMVLDLIDTLIDRKERGNAKNKRGTVEPPNTEGTQAGRSKS